MNYNSQIFNWITHKKTLNNNNTLNNNKEPSNLELNNFYKNNFSHLPIEMIYEIVCYFEYRDIYFIFSTCKTLYTLLCNDRFWEFYIRMHKIPIIKNISSRLTIKYYQKKWTTSLKNIIISKNGKCVNRIKESKNKITNPIILASMPLTALYPFFECCIKQRGSWIGIGVTDRNIKLNHGGTIGRQKTGHTFALFCQDSTLIRGNINNIEINDQTVKRKLQNGDKIKIELNFNTNQIIFTINNNSPYIISPEIILSSIKLYPCVNISAKSIIQMI